MIKRTMLAAIAAALAFAALPALASAYSVDLEEGNEGNFAVSGGAGQLNGPATVNCEEVTGEGQFTTSEGGTIEFTFSGCKGPFGINCTTPETEAEEEEKTAKEEELRPVGTITTTDLTFDVVGVDHNETTSPGALITPNGGHFATFNCSSFFKIAVTGNGIIGTVTAPEIDPETGKSEASETATISFDPVEKESKEQTHTTIAGDETETTYTLESSSNGGEEKASSEDAEGTMEFTEGPAIFTE